MKIDPELLIVVSISEKVKNSKSMQIFYYPNSKKKTTYQISKDQNVSFKIIGNIFDFKCLDFKCRY